MSDRRLQDLTRFYSILNQLEKTIGGPRALADCRGRMKWPARGVYFFREAGENRSDTGGGPRAVRVGTHALKTGGSTTLWGRLSTHQANPFERNSSANPIMPWRLSPTPCRSITASPFAFAGCANQP
jgi:hypothetical protein